MWGHYNSPFSYFFLHSYVHSLSLSYFSFIWMKIPSLSHSELKIKFVANLITIIMGLFFHFVISYTCILWSWTIFVLFYTCKYEWTRSVELNDNMKSVIRWGVLTNRFSSTYTVTVAIESLHEDLCYWLVRA